MVSLPPFRLALAHLEPRAGDSRRLVAFLHGFALEQFAYPVCTLEDWPCLRAASLCAMGRISLVFRGEGGWSEKREEGAEVEAFWRVF